MSQFQQLARMPKSQFHNYLFQSHPDSKSLVPLSKNVLLSHSNNDSHEQHFLVWTALLNPNPPKVATMNSHLRRHSEKKLRFAKEFDQDRERIKKQKKIHSSSSWFIVLLLLDAFFFTLVHSCSCCNILVLLLFAPFLQFSSWLTLRVLRDSLFSFFFLICSFWASSSWFIRVLLLFSLCRFNQLKFANCSIHRWFCIHWSLFFLTVTCIRRWNLCFREQNSDGSSVSCSEKVIYRWKYDQASVVAWFSDLVWYIFLSIIQQQPYFKMDPRWYPGTCLCQPTSWETRETNERCDFSQVSDNISMKWYREEAHIDDAILLAEGISKIQVPSRRNVDSLDFAIMIVTHIQSAISHFSGRIGSTPRNEIFHWWYQMAGDFSVFPVLVLIHGSSPPGHPAAMVAREMAKRRCASLLRPPCLSTLAICSFSLIDCLENEWQSLTIVREEGFSSSKRWIFSRSVGLSEEGPLSLAENVWVVEEQYWWFLPQLGTN